MWAHDSSGGCGVILLVVVCLEWRWRGSDGYGSSDGLVVMMILVEVWCMAAFVVIVLLAVGFTWWRSDHLNHHRTQSITTTLISINFYHNHVLRTL